MTSLQKFEILELHRQLTQTFGGDAELRAERSLDSALAAVERSLAENADLATCAATLAYHLALSRAFAEGNTRLAAAAAELFVLLNDGHLEADDEELARVFARIAAGDLSRRAVERIFASWVRVTHSPVPPAAPNQGPHDPAGTAAAAQETNAVPEATGSE